MRAALLNTAVVGVLTLGGLPALAMALTGDEPADVAPSEIAERDGDDQGPPPWARANGHGPKHDGRHGAVDRADRQRTTPPGWEGKDVPPGRTKGAKPGWKGKDVPPGWAKHGWTEPPGHSARS
jgi:hypothetical protein